MQTSVTTVNQSDASQQALAYNENRALVWLFNDSTELIYVLMGSGTASASNHSAQVFASGILEIGQGANVGLNVSTAIQVIWSAAGSGKLRVTEFTV
jgi:hypothetical protein